MQGLWKEELLVVLVQGITSSRSNLVGPFNFKLGFHGFTSGRRAGSSPLGQCSASSGYRRAGSFPTSNNHSKDPLWLLEVGEGVEPREVSAPIDLQ